MEDIREFYNKSEFSKYYFLATTKEEFLYLSGLSKLDTDHELYPLKAPLPGGKVVGRLIAKPVYYELLSCMDLEMPYIVDSSSLVIGNIHHNTVHPIFVEEVKTAVNEL